MGKFEIESLKKGESRVGWYLNGIVGSVTKYTFMAIAHASNWNPNAVITVATNTKGKQLKKTFPWGAIAHDTRDEAETHKIKRIKITAVDEYDEASRKMHGSGSYIKELSPELHKKFKEILDSIDNFEKELGSWQRKK